MPRLKLLIAIVRQPDRTSGKEHRRQRDVEHERRVIAPAEAAADIGELGVDARRLEGGAGVAEQIRDRFRGLVGRLHAEHEFEAAALPVVPGETGFRLEKHRVDRLGLELAVEHQQVRIVGRQLAADLLAIDRGLGVGRRGIPVRAATIPEAASSGSVPG